MLLYFCKAAHWKAKSMTQVNFEEFAKQTSILRSPFKASRFIDNSEKLVFKVTRSRIYEARMSGQNQEFNIILERQMHKYHTVCSFWDSRL